ncbi:hypothetical protein ACHAWO_011104 [Cyclotella atomus]|uniref:Uncharacterized protein n=1 Tax=Cyclotella atomus TaxID=382360 RepID=A0ABD3MRM3_9STRA
MAAAKLTIIRSLLVSAYVFLSPSLAAAAESSSNLFMSKHIVFSDVDGTLVHYPKSHHRTDSAEASSSDDELIRLPPSKTGTRGVLSKRTLELCHALRTGSSSSSSSITPDRDAMFGTTTPLVLISGMRTTTLFQRLPYLPRADAYVSESGGRIFYPVPMDESSDGPRDDVGLVDNLVIRPIVSSNSGLNTSPFRLMEDLKWKDRISNINAAGPDGFNGTLFPLEQRSGKLWIFATQLQQQGYVLDTIGYSAAFRINQKMQSTQYIHDNFEKVIHQIITNDLPKELGCSTNLGCIDIYPTMSGKRNCCDYLLKRFCGQNPQLKKNAYCMCDDDNDVEMATACKMAFLPSVTSESIRSLIERQRQAWNDGGDDDNTAVPRFGRLFVTEDIERGIVETGATERALELIMTELQNDNDDEAL